MPPVKTAVPPQAAPIYDAYLACLAARGVGNKTFDSGARCFLARFPDPQAWAAQPLTARLAGTRPQLQPLLNFLMLHGHLRPGYDYLLERKLIVIVREAAASPLGPDLKRFLAGAEALGYSVRARTGMASEVAIRVLIQTGRPLGELTDAGFDEFGQAVTEREARLGRALKHYHHALYTSRAVIYHLGAPAEPVPKRSTPGRLAAIVACQLEQHPHRPLREPAALELRQHHPADLRHRLAALVVGPQRDRSRHHVRRGLARNDHLDPVGARRNRLDIASDLVLDTPAGKRAAQFGHHDRVAPHPHIGIDIAPLNIPQPHRRSSSARALDPSGRHPGCLPSSTGTPAKRHRSRLGSHHSPVCGRWRCRLAAAPPSRHVADMSVT